MADVITEKSPSRGQLRFYEIRVSAQTGGAKPLADESKTGARPTRKSRFEVDFKELDCIEDRE